MLKVSCLRKGEESRVRYLFPSYKFYHYRHYGQVTKNVMAEDIFTQVSKAWREKGKVIVALDDTIVAGMTLVSDLTWESKYFGRKMAEIKYIITSGRLDNDLKIKKELIARAVNECKKSEIVHLACKIDAEDVSSIHALECCGFNLMGTQLTYTISFKKLRIPAIKSLCKVRKFKDDDLKHLIYLARSYSPQLTRFHVDPDLPQIKSERFYIEWIKNSGVGKFSDGILVAERNGKIVGFLTYCLNKELKQLSNINSIHRGLLVVSPEGAGASLALLSELATIGKSIMKLDMAEFEVYNYNYTVIKLLQTIGMSLSNARYVFHNYLN